MPQTLSKQEFIEKHPKGTAIEFAANLTGEHAEDGTVLFNDKGLAYLKYKSISDFWDHYIDGKDVEFEISTYVGDRDDDGNIIWHDKEHPLSDIDPEEDGSNVYLKFKPFRSK